MSKHGAKAPEKDHDRVGRLISECAADWGVEPSVLTHREFVDYLREQDGAAMAGTINHIVQNLGGFNRVRDALYPPTTANDNAIARERIRRHANIARKLGAERATEEFLWQRIEEQTSRIFKGRVSPARTPPKERGREREVVVCIGDTHWGSQLAGSETGASDYGPQEEARRLAQVVVQTCEYKHEYRDKTRLRVLLIGDMIHGCLHDSRDGAVLAEQQSSAIHLLIQAVGQFAAAYPHVTVECVTGNHGRDKSRHMERATAGKWDSRETVIYSAARMACSSLTNVEWHIPRSAFSVFALFGKKYFVTHGDGVIRVGNPGRAINAAELEKQVNRLNATLRDRDEYSVVVVGHVHQSAKILLNNGATVIVNGAMTPVDSYAVSVGIFESVSSQQLFEAVEGFPVGDSRTITLDRRVDADSSLDKVIKPWDGF